MDIKTLKTGDVIDRLVHIAGLMERGMLKSRYDELEDEAYKLKLELLRREKELVSISLWSARRLPSTWKEYAYDSIDKVTNTKFERL